jgi:ribosomal protein L6P/L9E
MKRAVLAVLAALAAAASVHALAQKPDAASASVTSTVPGKGTISNMVRVTASVEAIDVATRSVTLKGPKGDVVTLTVGPEVKNLAQVKVGDRVSVRYAEALTLELKKDGKELRQRSEREASSAAQPGERPGGAAGRQIKVIADVVAVDRKKQVVTLRGPSRTVELKLRDPEQIKLIKVGDQIEATYQEAVAVSLEPAPAAKPAAAAK